MKEKRRLSRRTGEVFLLLLIFCSLLVGCQQISLKKDCGCEQLLSTGCIDFEDLNLYSEYKVGDNFTSAGVIMEVDQFQLWDGSYTSGIARVHNGGYAGGSGQELQVNNVNVHFYFSYVPTQLSIHFGEYGGNVNMEINGDFVNVGDFAELDGTVIGGVNVEVINGFGNDKGVINLTGAISKFSIGGQELWIDDICPFTVTDCLDFEDPALGSTYNVGDSFVDSGVTMNVQPFAWWGGGYGYGYAEIGNLLLAGGSGQELQVNNVNIEFRLGYIPDQLSILFGEYGGNLNININGDFRNILDFADINGAVIGGVSVSVVNGYGNDQGIINLTGQIDKLIIGGQELWIDDICPFVRTNCVDFESLEPGARYVVNDTFWDSGVNVFIGPFRFCDGSLIEDGFALIDTQNMAGGSGNELRLNNVTAFFEFGFLPLGLSLRVGEYGGVITLTINGEFICFRDFSEIDGKIIGGVRVTVVSGGPGQGAGVIRFDGEIKDFSIGGQEFFIDDLCPLVKR